MAVSSFHRVFTFECRSDPDFAPPPSSDNLRRRHFPATGLSAAFHGTSSLILRFPPNFQRQLSTKARRNCSNIGVAQIVAASWSNNPSAGGPSAGTPPAPHVASAVDAATAPLPPLDLAADEEVVVADAENGAVQTNSRSYSSFLKSDGSKTIHAAERLGRGIVTDAITTPVVNTSAYFFKKTADLIDFKEKRQTSYEYGRYGNPTSTVLEEKI
ncbi:Pyridoxal phosphate-dependent transferase, major domain, partial [Sesbania bispinosa]